MLRERRVQKSKTEAAEYAKLLTQIRHDKRVSLQFKRRLSEKKSDKKDQPPQ